MTDGVYHFYPNDAVEREYYISNHDQTNPKKVGLALENFQNLTIEGNGSALMYRSRTWIIISASWHTFWSLLSWA